MGRALGLAWGRAGIHHIFPIDSVLYIPLLFRPLFVSRRAGGCDVLYNRRAGTKLLSQLQCIDRAILYALAAGCAFFRIDLCHVVRTDHIDVLEHGCRPNGKTAASAAVADSVGFPPARQRWGSRASVRFLLLFAESRILRPW